MSVNEASEAAGAKLAETLQGAMRVGDGLYVVAVGFSDDAARLLLTDRRRGMKVQSGHVAPVPSRDHLLVTGSETEAQRETLPWRGTGGTMS